METGTRFRCRILLLLAIFSLALPATLQAQFRFVTKNNTITITAYTGPGGDVVIPSAMNGLPVTGIGDCVFQYCYSLTSVVIPDSVISIGKYVFFCCTNLTSVAIPGSVNRLGLEAFGNCTSLTNLTISRSVTNIGIAAFANCTRLTSIMVDADNPIYSSADGVLFNKSRTAIIAFPSASGIYRTPNGITRIVDSAFIGCSGLTNVVIGNLVTIIGVGAFQFCTNLTKAFFCGNAPEVDGIPGSIDNSIFSGDTGTAYYVLGTTGWSSTFGGWPTVLWYQPQPVILGNGYGLGATTNGFGFTISWATNILVVVEASTNLANPVWTPVSTNALVNGTNYFSDPQWTNYPNRYYRIRSP